MKTENDIFEGQKRYRDAEKCLTEYMKHLSNFDLERAYKVEKLRDQLNKI